MARQTKGSLVLRNRIYYLLYFVDGKRYRKSLGTSDLKEAEARRDERMAPVLLGDRAKQLRALRHEIEDTEDEREEAEDRVRQRLTVADAWGAFLADRSRPQPSAATLKDYCQRWQKFTCWWQSGPGRERPGMEDVTRTDANSYALYLDEANLSSNRYNQCVQTARLVFRTLAPQCADMKNPFGETAKAGIRNKRLQCESRRPLSEGELAAVCGRAEGELRTLLAIGLYTALRLGDACTLRWEEVDLRRGRVVRQPSKTKARNGKALQIPLHPVLSAILIETPPAARREFVVPGMSARYERDRSSVSKILRRHFEACEIETTVEGGSVQRRCLVGFHSLRHSFVTLCAEHNVPLAVVQELCGHGSPAIQRAYLHIGEAATRAGIAALPSVEEFAADTPPAPENDAKKLAAVRAVLEEKKRLSATERKVLAILDRRAPPDTVKMLGPG